MIEYMATAGAVGFAWAAIVWRERRAPLWALLALALGLVAMLVKPTTGIFWILPVLAYRVGDDSRARFRLGGRRVDPVLAVLVAVPIVAAALWTRHADAIKAASEVTASLTSDALTSWNFGTLAQRLDQGTWQTIGERIAGELAGYALLLLPVSVLAIARSWQRWFWLGVLACAVLPPLVFTNLYLQHDYYLVAVSPALAAVLGLGAGFLWDRRPAGRAALATCAGVAVVAIVATYVTTHNYWRPLFWSNRDQENALPLAAEIDALVPAGELVALGGREWSPAVLYYARRWGQMQPGTRGATADVLETQGYRVLVNSVPDLDPISFLTRWPWVGALGSHTYAMGASPRELLGGRSLATDDVGAFDTAAAHGRDLTDGPVTLRCDRGGVSVPAGRHGTWLLGSASRQGEFPEGRLRVSPDLVPLPIRPVTFVSPALAADGHVWLSCSGAPAVQFTRVVDSGPPV